MMTSFFQKATEEQKKARLAPSVSLKKGSPTKMTQFFAKKEVSEQNNDESFMEQESQEDFSLETLLTETKVVAHANRDRLSLTCL